MSSYVKLTPKGLVAYRWDPERRKHMPHRPRKMSVWKCLRETCHISKGTTLGDIFEAVERYPALKTFLSVYSSCPVDEFHAQAKEPFLVPDSEPLTHLEIGWDFQIASYKGKKDVYFMPEFVAIGKDAADPDKTIRYSPSPMLMQRLANLPIRLRSSLTAYEPLPGEKRTVLEGRRDFSLLEVLDAIYWEISFFGGPADNAEFAEKMRNTVEDIRSGAATTIPIEEVLPRPAGRSGANLPDEGTRPCSPIHDLGESERKIIGDIEAMPGGFAFVGMARESGVTTFDFVSETTGRRVNVKMGRYADMCNEESGDA